MNGRHASRKFLLACFFALASSIMIFAGKLDGGEYITVIGLILGFYSAANVAQKRGNK